MKKKKKKVYIAGRMSGVNGWGFDNFHRAEAILGKDFTILNPAKFSKHTNKPWEWYILKALKIIAKEKPEYIVMIHGEDHHWQDSAGAKMELLFACKLGAEAFNMQLIEDGAIVTPIGQALKNRVVMRKDIKT